MVCLKYFSLLGLLGLAWATRPHYINGFRKLEDVTYSTGDLKILDRKNMLTLVNSPFVHVCGNLQNHGRFKLFTDKRAVANAQNCIEYLIDGRIVNKRLLLVRHNNPDLPLLVRFRGEPSSETENRLYSANYKDVILSSNGPAVLADGKEFEIDISQNFVNSGLLAVIGTESHTAQLRINLNFEGTVKALFLNLGIIFLKNAIVRHEVNFRLLGCIVIGAGSTFYTKSSLTFGGQVIHFLPGSSTLYIASTRNNAPQKYVVTNFPLGSSIQFEEHMTELDALDKSVAVLSSGGKEIVMMEFRFHSLLDAKKFHLENGRLTYEDDLSRQVPHAACEQLPYAMGVAGMYEIHAGEETLARQPGDGSSGKALLEESSTAIDMPADDDLMKAATGSDEQNGASRQKEASSKEKGAFSKKRVAFSKQKAVEDDGLQEVKVVA